MNDCVNGEMRDALPELVNGTLRGDEALRVTDHLRECAVCAGEVELLRTARAALRLAPAVDTTKIAESVRVSTAERLAARRVRDRAARAAGLALVVVLGAVALWPARDDSPVAPAAPVVVAGGDDARSQTGRPATEHVAPLALGTDIGGLEDAQLLVLLDEVSELEALPRAEPASVYIEPLTPVVEEELR